MGTTLGNVCLVLAALLCTQLFSSTFRLTPPGGHDEGATGYMMIVVVLMQICLWVLLSVAAAAIARNGGFDWVSDSKTTRNLLVTALLIASLLTTISCALIGIEPDSVPKWLFRIMSFAYMAIPLILIASGFILLHDFARAAVPLAVYKWPLTLLLGLSAVGASVFLYGLISVISGSATERREKIRAMEDEANQYNLNYIDSCDVNKDFLALLPYTHSGRSPDLRQKAIAKVKSHPAWQQQLVSGLENQGAIEVFTFLADNEVDDKSLFPDAVRRGVLSIADWVRRSISYKTHPSHAYPHEFMSEVNLCLTVIQKFEGMGVDFRPAVQELRAAFDEPCEAGKLHFDCVEELDGWIKKKR